MDEQPILVERQPGYRVITLNRPQRLNAFTEAMHQALRMRLPRPRPMKPAAPCC